MSHKVGQINTFKSFFLYCEMQRRLAAESRSCSWASPHEKSEKKVNDKKIVCLNTKEKRQLDIRAHFWPHLVAF